jgi:hypothetical protein
MKTSKEVFEFLQHIESKYNLFERQIDSLFFWKIIRFDLMQHLLSKLGYMKSVNKVSKGQFLKQVLSIIYNSRYSVFRTRTQPEILVHENPRKIKGPDGYYDPYTCSFVKKLIETKADFEIVDEGYKGVHYEPSSSIRSFGDSVYYDLFYRFYSRLRKIQFTEIELELLSDLERDIISELGVNVSIRPLIDKKIAAFRNQYTKYGKIFSHKKPKKLYIVCAYGKEGMILAAREHGIEVTEFQHGIISKYHTAYSFPKEVKIPYFPDKMFLFGKYWYDSTPLPLTESDVQYIGYYALDLENQADIVRETKRVLFISQWTIGKELSLKAIETAESNPDYTIIYRLHPAERNNWKDSYPELYKSNLSNLVVDTSKSLLSEQLLKSEYVICAYSIGAFEALSFGCKVILLYFSGIEHMEYLVENGYAMQQELDEDIKLSSISNLKPASKEYFFGV